MFDTDVKALFIDRTHHRAILVADRDTASGSRLGGKPPARLAMSPPRCPRCGGPLQYVLTLAADTLGAAIARGDAVSLLACRDYGCLMSSHALTNPSSTVVLAHEDAPRATAASELDSECEGRALTLGDIAPDPLDEDQQVYTDASKLGGGPGYIQPSGSAEAEKGMRQGSAFLFQWSENSLATANLRSDACVFGWGVVYVFCRVDPATRCPALTDLVGFWQST